MAFLVFPRGGNGTVQPWDLWDLSKVSWIVGADNSIFTLTPLFALYQYGSTLTGMHQIAKDKFDVMTKTVAILGGIISAIALIITLQSSTSQRETELRWKQANLAMELVDSMLSDPQAFDALRMIDWESRTYNIKTDQNEVIGAKEVRRSLDVRNNSNLSPSGVYIRESFDRLFYHMGRIERSLRTDLIIFDDIRSPLEYYAKILHSKYEDVLAPYITQLGVEDAEILLDRFQSAR